MKKHISVLILNVLRVSLLQVAAECHQTYRAERSDSHEQTIRPTYPHGILDGTGRLGSYCLQAPKPARSAPRRR